MFHVLDDRPGLRAAVAVARPGPLRVYAHVQAGANDADLTGLRVLLVVDLLFRAAERAGLQVLTTRVLAGEAAGQAAVERAAGALGIHPPALPAALPEAWPDGHADVHVTDGGTVGEDDRQGVVIRAASARLAADACPGDAAAGMLGGHDPLAVRFALMSIPRHQPGELTAAMLDGAARTLGEWRGKVARWAESPSRRIPEPTQAEFKVAFESLDAVALLSSLSGLAADEAVPPGARFESFVYADRILGLDLPRDIGR
ncbi:MAG TPA: hypothetical protein VIZ43_24000 [Trebonia sp.]